jgi:plasmid stability protein
MATLTLHDVPEVVLARLDERARAHGRSLTSEVLAALETLETASVSPPADGTAANDPATDPSPMDPSVALSEEALAKIRATLARFPGSAKATQQPRDPEDVRAELELFARLRSQFKGPPLTSEEIIAAIERDSHPPELDRFGNRINPDS